MGLFKERGEGRLGGLSHCLRRAEQSRGVFVEDVRRFTEAVFLIREEYSVFPVFSVYAVLDVWSMKKRV